MKNIVKEEVEQLKPCPLCGGEARLNVYSGISCQKCGLWLGNGTMANKLGGIRKVWQMRVK